VFLTLARRVRTSPAQCRYPTACAVQRRSQVFLAPEIQRMDELASSATWILWSSKLRLLNELQKTKAMGFLFIGAEKKIAPFSRMSEVGADKFGKEPGLQNKPAVVRCVMVKKPLCFGDGNGRMLVLP